MKNAQREKFSPFRASDYKVAIVIARFNSGITDALLSSAEDALRLYAVPEKNIRIFKVAGAVEIPVILARLARTKKYDALIALGAVIKGDTPHFDYVAKIVAEGILRVMLDSQRPVGFGILTTNNLKQARERRSAGGEAVIAALHNARLLREIK